VVPYVGGISNFASDPKHSQQCFVTSEPLLAAKLGLKVKNFLIADAGYNPYTTVLISRRSFVEKNLALTKSLVQQVRDGWGQYVAGADLTKRVDARMHELNGSIDLATLASSGRAQVDLIVPKVNVPGGGVKLGEMTEARWKELIDQLKSLKVIEIKSKAGPEAKDLFINI